MKTQRSISASSPETQKEWGRWSTICSYSQVSTTKCPATVPVASEAALELALIGLQACISETRAAITHESLPTLPVDATQMLQLFQNLIENAIHYRGAAPPRVRISAERQGDFWLFSVRDNGIGIAPKHRERIFEPFKRLHGMERPGSGIGLAICKKIVERYEGQIWVESELGQGSIFYFTLPA